MKTTEIEKLHLKQFRQKGVDYDLAHPKKRFHELLADLRYLGNSAYPRLKKGETWGEWKMDDTLRYFAKIIDTLRSIYFVISEKKSQKSSWWQCYWAAKKYMKSEPPKTLKEIRQWNEKRKEWQKKISKILVPSDIPTLLKPGVIVLPWHETEEQRKWFSWLKRKLRERRKSLITPSDIPKLLESGKTIFRAGKILVKPHGEWAISGKKKGFVSAKNYKKHIEVPVYLIQGNEALGLIEISKPIKINLKKFDDMRDLHKVSEKERKTWWPNIKEFYYYPIKVIQRFRPFKRIARPKGAQTWLASITFKSEVPNFDPRTPSLLSDEQLEKVAQLCQKLFLLKKIPGWTKEDLLNYYILIKREMKKRDLEIEENQIDVEVERMLQTLKKSSTLILKFPGTKGLVEEENENHKFHSSLLLEINGKRLLIDWGQINQGNLADLKPNWILNTHAHPDHLGGLNDMEVYISDITERILPNLYKDFNIIQHIFESYEKFNLGPFKITAIPVAHSIKAPMHVFKIEIENFNILYAPDILWWHKGDRKKYLKNIDLAIIDGSSFSRDLVRTGKDEKYGHASIKTQLEWYAENTKEILITHCGKEVIEAGDQKIERSIKQLTSIPVKIVKDNEKIEKALVTKELAPVYPSGQRLGKEIQLREVLPSIKSFYPHKIFAWLVGGLVNWGKTRGDIDILWRCSPKMPSYFKKILEFRFGRQFLNPDLARRIQHHYDMFHGPFTKAIPIYAMLIQRINLAGQVLELEEFRPEEGMINLEWDEEKEGYTVPDFQWLIEKQKAGSPRIIAEAKASKNEDKVKIFRYFLPLKPTRGYFPEQRQTIENFLSLFKKEDFPVFSSKKYDGMHMEIHKDGKKVLLISEDGEDNTARFPTVVKEIQNLNLDKGVLLAEFELWKEGRHQPREAITGYAHEKGTPDDSGVIANIFDVVYFQDDPGDIHKFSFQKRLSYLNKIKFPQSTWKVPDISKKLNKAPYIISKNPEELKKDTLMLRKLPGSEGNVAKMAKAIYRLDGQRSGMIKFHNSSVVYGIVTKTKETKVKGVFNYYFGLLPDKGMKMKNMVKIKNEFYHQSGRTFSTSLKVEEGNVLEIECETFNIEHHLPEDEYSVSLWAPRVMGKVERKPDTISEARERAKKNLVLMEKEVSKEGIIYKFLVEKQDPYLVNPPEDKTYKYTIQHHFRGRTVHMDIRIEGKNKDYLVGWTITDQIKGAIKKPVMTLEDAKHWNAKDISKIDWKTGLPVLRPGIKPGYKKKYAELVAIRKSPEPIEWLNAQGVVEKGQVGATKKYPGVFLIIDKGIAEYGCFSSGTLVLTSKGFKPIEKIKKGELLFSNPEFTEVLETFHRETDKIYELKIRGFPAIKATANHRFFAFKKPRQYLGRRFLKLKEIVPQGTWLRLDQLATGDYIAIEKNTIETNLTIPFKNHLIPIDENLAWTLGFFIAEGSVSEPYWQICFNNQDKELLKRAMNSMEQAFGLKGTILQYPTEFRGQISNRELSKTFREMFYTSEGKKIIPPRFLQLKKEILKSFMKGLYDGDGRKTSSKQCQLSNTSGDVLWIWQMMLTKFDYIGGEYWNGKKGQISWNRKALDLVDGTLENPTDLKKTHFLSDSKYIFLKIEKIEEISFKGPVFNLETSNNTIPVPFQSHNSQKSFFHEYFFNGKLKGRYLLRQLRPKEFRGLKKVKLSDGQSYIKIPLSLYSKLKREFKELKEIALLDEALTVNELRLAETVLPPVKETPFRKEAAWFFIKPLDETPYAISDRAKEVNWIPPQKISALPKEWRKKVPEEFKYWKFENKKKRIEVRNAYIKTLEETEKAISPAKKWARMAYHFILGQRTLEVWWALNPAEKMGRVWRLFERFTTKYPLKEEWKEEVITWLRERKTEVANSLIRAITRPPLQIKPQKGGLERIEKRRIPFVLQWHFWRGQKVVRTGPTTQHWDLRINFPEREGLMHFVLSHDPTRIRETTAIEKPSKYKEWMEIEGYLPPKNERDKMSPEEKKKLPPGIEKANPTKNTPAFIEIIDKGEVVPLEDGESFKKFEFKGKKLKGLWILDREDLSKIWVFKKSELPSPK